MKCFGSSKYHSSSSANNNLTFLFYILLSFLSPFWLLWIMFWGSFLKSHDNRHPSPDFSRKAFSFPYLQRCWILMCMKTFKGDVLGRTIGSEMKYFQRQLNTGESPIELGIIFIYRVVMSFSLPWPSVDHYSICFLCLYSHSWGFTLEKYSYM